MSERDLFEGARGAGREDPAPGAGVRLKGLIEHITFQNPENGYTIARLRPEGEGEPVTVVGAMAVSAGESVQLEGIWDRHPRFGRQLQVDSCIPAYPATAEGIERYLGSGLIKGIGPVMAERIVARFGDSSLEVIDTRPRRLLEIEGLGEKRVRAIAEAWKEQRRIRDVMVFLQSHGVGTGHAVRIYQQYGEEAIHSVRQDPYRLQRDVRGIGFQTADRIAGDLGIARDAPERVRAGLRYLLEEAADEGHLFLPMEELRLGAAELLDVDPGRFPEALSALRDSGEVVVEGQDCYPGRLHRAERGVARALERLLSAPGPPLERGPGEDAAGDGSLGKDQRWALEQVDAGKVLVVTGGPGTGKTTITRQIVGRLEASGLRVALCSPTGRASKRLTEATGREARTIHRLLEFAPREGGFRRDDNLPLEAEAVIVDESSMIDIHLMNALLRAVPDAARLVLVGDADQLPSVGPRQRPRGHHRLRRRARGAPAPHLPPDW